MIRQRRGAAVVTRILDSFGLLAARRFRAFWLASLLAGIGAWAQQVAEPWLLLTLGASPFLIGLDTFALNAPVFLFSLAGGAIADRLDRRNVVVGLKSVEMLCPMAVVVLLATGTTQPWMIVLLSAVVGITEALSTASFQSVVPLILAREQIDRGLALDATQFNVSRIVGPAIAGLLMAGAGAFGCFVLSALSYVPLIGVAFWILPGDPARPPVEGPSVQAGMSQGMGHVLRDPRQRYALLTVLVTSVLCAPLVTFCPVLVKSVFHGGPGLFSAAFMAIGVGGVLGASGLLGLPAGVDRRRLISASAAVNAGLIMLIALTPWFWLALPLLVCAGAAMTASKTAANALLQTGADARCLGRTVGLYALATQGGISIGALLTGTVAGLAGVQFALLLNGVVALAAQTAIWRAWRRSTGWDGRTP